MKCPHHETVSSPSGNSYCIRCGADLNEVWKSTQQPQGTIMDKNLKRVAMSTTDAQWLYTLIQNYITEQVIGHGGTVEDYRMRTDVIKRIKHAAEL